MTAAPASKAAHALSGVAFFDDWKAARLQDSHRKPMGETGLHQAEFIWRKWLAFCHARRTDWQDAGPDDVRAFSGDISPRKPGHSSAVSPVTLRRYWRILNDLYAYALLSGTLTHNPAAPVMPAISERTSSLALPPHLWAPLQAGLPGGDSMKERRNRLVLLLMMRCALTVTEIISLKMGGVQAHEGTPEAVSRSLAFEPDTAFMAPLAACPTYTVQLSGSRPVQTRQLVLDAPTSQALHDWLQVRRRGAGGAQERLIVGDANGTAITPKGLYNIAQAFMARCLPGVQIAQAGPNTLRNTCIASWLNQGVPVTEIQRCCGLKDQSVLIRLQQHIHPPVAL
ncbi:MAG: site-specific integrase [Pseudomonadota bacterium]|nr:site-specific integrase [Pseudomonadota bacterium]